MRLKPSKSFWAQAVQKFWVRGQRPWCRSVAVVGDAFPARYRSKAAAMPHSPRTITEIQPRNPYKFSPNSSPLWGAPCHFKAAEPIDGN